MIFTTIISWLIFTVGASIAFVVFSKKKKTLASLAFGFCWLGLSIIFYLEGLAAMFARRGMEDITERLFIVMAVISYLLLVPASIFVLEKAYNRKDLSLLISLLYLLGLFPYYYLFFNGVMVAQETSYFSLNFHIMGIAALFFSLMFAPIAFFALYVAIKLIKQFIKDRSQDSMENFLYAASIIIAGFSAFPEHLGLAYGWQIAFFKTMILAAALLGFAGAKFIDKVELNKDKKEI